MRNFFVYIILFAFVSLSWSTGSWLPDEKISISSDDNILGEDGFGSNHTGIALDQSGTPHVVWFSGNPSAIFYSSRTGASTWIPPQSLTVATAIARYPSIAIDSLDRKCVVWHDYRVGGINNIELFFNMAGPGQAWSHETRITNSMDINSTNGNNNYIPTIICDRFNRLHLAWYSFHWSPNNPDILYKNAADPFSWDTTISMDSMRVTNSLLYENPFPAMAADSTGNIHLAWCDNQSGFLEIYYKKKNNQTGLWESTLQLTQDSATCQFPVIVADNQNNLYVFWSRYKNATQSIFYKIYNTGSQSWSTTMRATPDYSFSNYPVAQFDSHRNLHLAWTDNRDGVLGIYYKYWDTQNQLWSLETKVSSNSGQGQYPSIAVDNQLNIHIIWQDNRNGHADIYYRQLQNITGIDALLWKQYE